jgi:bile acid-coenzyme A ligase
MLQPQTISFGRRISELASRHPERTAVVFVPQDGDEVLMSWFQLDQESTRIARFLASKVEKIHKTVVVLGLPNCLEHFLVAIAAWKVGACVLPLSSAMAARERDELLRIASPSVIVADWDQADGVVVTRQQLRQARDISDEPLPDCVAAPGKAIASGGSTGLPKIIVDPSPWAKYPGQWLDALGRGLGMRSGQTQLVAGPLYHNGPFTWSHMGLFEDHKLVVMERFDPTKYLALLERHRVNFGFIVPTMMQRLIRVPGVGSRDFSSVEGFWHAGAPCAPWLKRAWIELIGGEKLYEMYGSTEAVGFTTIRGDDWLEHPGSVGQPYHTEMRIFDEEGTEVPPGVVGEIFMRPANGTGFAYQYLGAPPAKTTSDGFASVGDLGWVDKNGYLFLADRRVDLILSGGANIYPAEIEATLTEHPEVADVAVIGVPDEDWGKRVHAVVQLRREAPSVSVSDLDAYCRKQLTSYKVPKSYEFVSQLPRNEAGKLRRSDLIEERKQGWTSNMIRVLRMPSTQKTP